MNGAELAFFRPRETVQRTIRAMFQPSGSKEEAVEGGEAGRKPKLAPEAPAVDPRLRAGAKLAQAREIKGLSLDEIAAKIHVRRDYLEALEAMNVKLLPGKAYALAYLKSYAKLLGLDSEALIRQFQLESALSREDAQPQLRNPESKPGRERPWLAALVIALVVTGFLGWRAWETRTSDPRLQTADASAPATPATTAQSDAANAPAPEAPSAVIEVKALQQAWLEVRGPDGTIFLSRTLKPGDRYRPEVGAGWTLHARDGGAFEVSLDGAPIGLLGEAGAPVLGRRVDTLASSVSLVQTPHQPAAAAHAPTAAGLAAKPPTPATAAPAPAAPATPVPDDADIAPPA
jgi:transcriptional regulator with XRE-family HTH domain